MFILYVVVKRTLFRGIRVVNILFTDSSEIFRSVAFDSDKYMAEERRIEIVDHLEENEVA